MIKQTQMFYIIMLVVKLSPPPEATPLSQVYILFISYQGLGTIHNSSRASGLLKKMDRRQVHPALQDLYTERSHAFQRVHKNASVFFCCERRFHFRLLVYLSNYRISCYWKISLMLLSWLLIYLRGLLPLLIEQRC